MKSIVNVTVLTASLILLVSGVITIFNICGYEISIMDYDIFDILACLIAIFLAFIAFVKKHYVFGALFVLFLIIFLGFWLASEGVLDYSMRTIILIINDFVSISLFTSFAVAYNCKH